LDFLLRLCEEWNGDEPAGELGFQTRPPDEIGLSVSSSGYFDLYRALWGSRKRLTELRATFVHAAMSAGVSYERAADTYDSACRFAEKWTAPHMWLQPQKENWAQERRNWFEANEAVRKIADLISTASDAAPNPPEQGKCAIPADLHERAEILRGTARQLPDVQPLPADSLPAGKPHAEASDGRADRKANKLDPARFRHGPDFRSCHWDGTDYTFTPTQAACVKVLWAAMENGTPDVGQQYILVEGAGAESQSLKDVFKGSRAWRNMIVKGEKQGSYRLAEAT
jgi:hypothetical protein